MPEALCRIQIASRHWFACRLPLCQTWVPSASSLSLLKPPGDGLRQLHTETLRRQPSLIEASSPDLVGWVAAIQAQTLDEATWKAFLENWLMSLEKIIPEYLSRSQHLRNPEAEIPENPETVGGMRPSVQILLVKGRSHSGESSPSVTEGRTNAPSPENKNPKKGSRNAATGDSSVIYVPLCTSTYELNLLLWEGHSCLKERTMNPGQLMNS